MHKTVTSFIVLAVNIVAIYAATDVSGDFSVLYPFPKTLFGTPIPPNPINDPNSNTYVFNLNNQTIWGGVNTQPIARPLSTLPQVPLSCSCTGTSPGAVNKTVQIPTGQHLNPSSDGPLLLWGQTTTPQYCVELWQVKNDTTTHGYKASWGGLLPDLANSTGVFPGSYGMSATGISYLATIITQNDVLRGSIDHAIAIQASTIDLVWVPPAVRQDTNAGSHPGHVHEGARVYFPPDVNCTGCANQLSKLVFAALQKYGGFVLDQTGNSGFNMIVAEDSSAWTAAGNALPDPITTAIGGKPNYAQFTGLPWSKLQVLQPQNTSAAATFFITTGLGSTAGTDAMTGAMTSNEMTMIANWFIVLVSACISLYL